MQTKNNLAGHQQNAREKGHQITIECIVWVARWKYVSAAGLAEFIYQRFRSKRPQIAYQLMKKGLLEQIEVPEDHREKMGGIKVIYRITNAAKAYLFKHEKRLLKYCNGLNFSSETKPHWVAMSHLFVIQNIVAATGQNPLSDEWLSEHECRRAARLSRHQEDQRHLPIPDAAFKTEDGQEVWLEVELTEKRGKKRALMVSQYHSMFLWQDQNFRKSALLGGKVTDVWFIVPDDRIGKIYNEKAFGAERLNKVERTASATEDVLSEDENDVITPRKTIDNRIVITVQRTTFGFEEINQGDHSRLDGIFMAVARST